MTLDRNVYINYSRFPSNCILLNIQYLRQTLRLTYDEGVQMLKVSLEFLMLQANLCHALHNFDINYSDVIASVELLSSRLKR